MGLALLILILILNLIVAVLYLLRGLTRVRDRKQERGHRAKYFLLFL